jgi:hypothetical protein
MGTRRRRNGGMGNDYTIQVSVNPIVYIDHYYLVNGDGLSSATLQK